MPNPVSNPCRPAPASAACIDGRKAAHLGIGVMFLGFFGTWWLSIGGRALFAHSPWILPAILLGGGMIVLMGWRLNRGETPSAEDAGQATRRRIFRNINIAQWSAIIALIVALNLAGLGEWLLPGILFIVGVHFFPLAVLFRNKAHLILGAALSAWAVVYPLALGPMNPAGPTVAGSILWCGAVWMLIKARRTQA